jgi:hypothetical protein
LRDHSKAERPRQRGNLGRLAERDQNLVGIEQQGQRGQEADKDDGTRSLDVESTQLGLASTDCLRAQGPQGGDEAKPRRDGHGIDIDPRKRKGVQFFCHGALRTASSADDDDGAESGKVLHHV